MLKRRLHSLQNKELKPQFRIHSTGAFNSQHMQNVKILEKVNAKLLQIYSYHEYIAKFIIRYRKFYLDNKKILSYVI